MIQGTAPLAKLPKARHVHAPAGIVRERLLGALPGLNALRQRLASVPGWLAAVAQSLTPRPHTSTAGYVAHGGHGAGGMGGRVASVSPRHAAMLSALPMLPCLVMLSALVMGMGKIKGLLFCQGREGGGAVPEYTPRSDPGPSYDICTFVRPGFSELFLHGL